MCSEGDIGIIELLNDIDENEEGEIMSPAEILRFQDPIDGMNTGLHAAILGAHVEVVWLLLWLASDLPTQAFPENVSQAAQAMGAGRNMASGADVRSPVNEQGQTAEDVARRMGNTWAMLLGGGLLNVRA